MDRRRRRGAAALRAPPRRGARGPRRRTALPAPELPVLEGAVLPPLRAVGGGERRGRPPLVRRRDRRGHRLVRVVDGWRSGAGVERRQRPGRGAGAGRPGLVPRGGRRPVRQHDHLRLRQGRAAGGRGRAALHQGDLPLVDRRRLRADGDLPLRRQAVVGGPRRAARVPRSPPGGALGRARAVPGPLRDPVPRPGGRGRRRGQPHVLRPLRLRPPAGAHRPRAGGRERHRERGRARGRHLQAVPHGGRPARPGRRGVPRPAVRLRPRRGHRGRAARRIGDRDVPPGRRGPLHLPPPGPRAVPAHPRRRSARRGEGRRHPAGVLRRRLRGHLLLPAEHHRALAAGVHLDRRVARVAARPDLGDPRHPRPRPREPRGPRADRLPRADLPAQPR